MSRRRLKIDDLSLILDSHHSSCLLLTYYCYPNLTEIDKRNKYLEIAGIKEIDFLLVIDSDEYAVIDMNELSSNLAKIKKYKTSTLVEGERQ
jgi:hypothetical protein